jgi:hypothetical protein
MAKTSWTQLGREIAAKLQNETDPDRIAQIGQDAIAQIQQHDKPDNALKSVNREVLKVFPRKSEETPGYYYDEGGKAEWEKWRHIIFKTLTLEGSEPEAPKEGDKASLAKPTKTPTKATRQSTQKIKGKMTIEITLDDETQKALETVLSQDSSRKISEVASTAIAAYCKSIANKKTENIETISTHALLTEDRYKTLPGRGEELTRRAIKAIQIYNDNAYGDVKPWAITQSAIARLIGAKPSKIKEALQEFNAYDYNKSKGIDGYSNRSIEGDIGDYIKIAELVPDGLPD